jgi:hypothetical protein
MSYACFCLFKPQLAPPKVEVDKESKFTAVIISSIYKNFFNCQKYSTQYTMFWKQTASGGTTNSKTVLQTCNTDINIIHALETKTNLKFKFYIFLLLKIFSGLHIWNFYF